MSPLLLLPYYFHWHYSQGLIQAIGVIQNCIWFFWHFFSIGELSRTLFKPWMRLHEERVRGGGIADMLQVWLINILMMFAGAVIRLTMILLGLIFIALTIVIGAIAYIVWFALPILLVVFPTTGVVLLFNLL